ncbi:TlpA family protein disulfide reductase [bacterium]|nr:TlpA family protein disulfide reductase [bacterium]
MGKAGSERTNKILKIAELILIPPGYAAIFIWIHQNSVYHFATHPAITISVFLIVGGISIVLIYLKRKEIHRVITWFGGLVGVPGLIFCTVILGYYFTSQEKFESLGTTFNKLEETEGQTAPDFAFTLVSNGETRHLSDYNGDLVLVNVWATWCIPCLAELPELNKLQIKYRKKGLVVINLSDESFEKIENYLRKNPMKTVHGRIDKKNPIPDFYQFGRTRPASFLIARNGTVLKTIVGAERFSFFETLVEHNL